MEWQRRLYSGRRKPRFVYGNFFQGLLNFWGRMTGRFRFEDRIRIACMCEPPNEFLRFGLMIPHPYGITLSADEIGADCCILQNVTIGTNGRNMREGELTDGHKPCIGNLVRMYPGSVVFGKIRIGDCVIIASNSLVDKDVPDNSIVYGHNVIKPLKKHHYGYLRNQLWHAMNVYNITPGMAYKHRKIYIDENWAKRRRRLFEGLEKDRGNLSRIT